jgi:dihydrofolate synthase/folylpolyglutamate synthase
MKLDNFLSKFVQTTDYPTLDAMHYIMGKLDFPEKHLKFLHIAGTNGKGSICEMLNQILICSNYKVGKFISPHLFVSNESICINNMQITDEEFLEYKDTFEKLSQDYFKETGRQVTRFEILTSLAILYFYKNNCDIVILEVGLGGLYDCTNIVNSLISVFGSIGFDHTAILGNTIEEIATQKAGIIKENSNTVIFEQPALPVIESACTEKNSNLNIIRKSDISNYSFDSNYQYFNYLDYKNLIINLKGKKQIENACCVVKCIEILNKSGFEISKTNLYTGLKNVTHPARFEKISNNPQIIFDGAHNENAMRNFIQTIKDLYPFEEKTFMISMITTKDYKTVLKLLLNAFDKSTFIFTDGTDENKFFKGQILYDYAQSLHTSNHLEYSDFAEGIKKLNSTINFIVGSFYVYDKAKELLK